MSASIFVLTPSQYAHPRKGMQLHPVCHDAEYLLDPHCANVAPRTGRLCSTTKYAESSAAARAEQRCTRNAHRRRGGPTRSPASPSASPTSLRFVSWARPCLLAGLAGSRLVVLILERPIEIVVVRVALPEEQILEHLSRVHVASAPQLTSAAPAVRGQQHEDRTQANAPCVQASLSIGTTGAVPLHHRK